SQLRMRITRLDSQILRLPSTRPVTLPMSGAGQGTARPQPAVLLVQVETDAQITGIGFGTLVMSDRALLATIEDDPWPLLNGENPLSHERLWAKIQACENPLFVPAYVPVDIALWDIKSKKAGLPLWQLLGGARGKVPVHSGQTADPNLSAGEVIALART